MPTLSIRPDTRGSKEQAEAESHEELERKKKGKEKGKVGESSASREKRE